MSPPTVDVSVGAFSDAGKSYLTGHDSLATAIDTLTGSLTDNWGAAGTDTSGKKWSDAFDPSAYNAVDFAAGMVNCLGQLHDLCLATSVNHANAEVDAGVKPNPADRIPLPAGTSHYNAPKFNGTYGGGTSPPHGWSLISRWLQGHTWPNGDPDKLNSLARAWQTAANAVDAVVQQISGARGTIAAQQTPEVEKILHWVDIVTGRLQQTSHIFTELSTDCGDYATHLGDCHRQIVKELVAGGLIAGGVIAIVTILTDGAGDAPVAGGAAGVVAREVIGAIVALTTTVETAVPAIAAVAGVGMLTTVQPLLDATPTQFNSDATGSQTVQQWQNLPEAPNVMSPELDDVGLEHVRDSHFPGGATAGSDKGIFNAGTDLDELVRASEDVPARGPSGTGRYERIVDAGRIIGTTAADSGGLRTSRYMLVQDKWGGVITMYPFP